jgi:hypothetical protein
MTINYRYLKAEVAAPLFGVRTFSAVTWHNEDPLRLILTSRGKCDLQNPGNALNTGPKE